VRSKHRLSVPENRPPNDKALSAERPIAFLEPASLRPWIPLPARGPFQSSSAPSGDAEPAARRQRLEHMGRSAGQTEMDAVADLREDIRTLGAGGRESQRGFRASGDADFTSARCVNPDQLVKTAVAQRHRPRSHRTDRHSVATALASPPPVTRVTSMTRSAGRHLDHRRDAIGLPPRR
jgi:hypothetical protein